jgi:hypothetical protein
MTEAIVPPDGPPAKPTKSSPIDRAAVDTARKDKDKHHMSAFAQTCEIFNLIDIDKIIAEAGTDKWFKKFNTRQHLVTMLYSQIAGANSLRELENGLEIFRGEINHFGLDFIPGRTTIAYANEHRDYTVFESIYNEMLRVVLPVCSRSKHGAPESNFKFDAKLYSIDSTVIDLCHDLFDWAAYRKTKGGVKVHVMLDNRAYLPVWAHISEAKHHDQKILETIDPVRGLTKGSVVCIDRAYNDYAMLNLWDEREITFVCRAKDNMSYTVIEDRPVPNSVGRPPISPKGEEQQQSHVISDQIVKLANPKAQLDYPKQLRMVTFWVEEKSNSRLTNRQMKFFTNNFKYSSATIADLYKSRWQIETFFRHMKSNLSIKSFLGTSANAVKTQVYVALIAFLLIRYLQATTKVSWCFSHLLATVRLILHVHRDLIRWLDRKRFDHLPGQRMTKNKGKPPGDHFSQGRLF